MPDCQSFCTLSMADFEIDVMSVHANLRDLYGVSSCYSSLNVVKFFQSTPGAEFTNDLKQS